MSHAQRFFWFSVLLGVTTAAHGESLYVAERIKAGLRADLLESSAVVKTVETGAVLEVLERFDKQVRVRDPQGIEGWIESRYLSPDPPARLQISKLQSELSKSQTQTAEAQAQLKKAQAQMSEQAAKIQQLEKGQAEKPAPTPVVPEVAAAPTPAAVKPDRTDNRITWGLLWIGISFAMLGLGFVAGVKWLRESIRKRSGGMYLRI